jgi:hypothetical protein
VFPFGFGLSYTTFEYTGIKANSPSIKDTDGVTIEVAVKTAGNAPGKEVIQLYLHEQNPAVRRPEKELKAFHKIALAPGEEKLVTFQLSKRDFAYYDADLRDWNVRSGTTCASSSAKDLARAGKKVRLVHKRPEGEVAAAGALQGHSSGAGAEPEQPVCEQAVAFTLRQPLAVGVVFFVGEAFPCSGNEEPLSSLRGFRPLAPGSAAGSSPDWERFG